MDILVITSKNFSDYKEQLLDLYDPERKRPEKYILSLENSDFIIVAMEDERVIGVVRIITDMYMCAMIIDLLVHPEYRNRWIWGRLVKESVGLCLEKEIKNIELVADPNNPGLVRFYEWLGFEHSLENGVHMVYRKNF